MRNISYDTHKGFLYYFTDLEKSFLQDMTLTLANPDVDGGGSYTWTGKVWLPTYTQMGFGDNNNIAEATQFNKYIDDNSRKKYVHEKCAENNRLCIQFGLTMNDIYYHGMSSAGLTSYGIWCVSNQGSSISGVSSYAYVGFAPCIKIKRTDVEKLL